MLEDALAAGEAHHWSLEQRVAVVTGGTRGIGAGIADALAAAGADVVLTYREHMQEAASVAKAIEARGRRAYVMPLDVRSAASVASFTQDLQRRVGRVDVLVNNAGIYPRHGALAMPDAEWNDVLTVNLTGPFRVARAMAQVMAEQGHGGCIVNIGSIAALVSDLGMCHYTVSKAGLQGLTRALALELAPHRITVNAVDPGLIDAPGLAEAAPELMTRFLRRVPLERVGQPRDVAAAVLFLTSPGARWMTGQHLVVDGGVSVAPHY